MSFETVNTNTSAYLVTTLNLTETWVGYAALAVFACAYVLVILEDKLKLRKSKPVLMAASLIWLLIAIAYAVNGKSELIGYSIRHTFLEYAELFFFLLVAMTYINAMVERGVFERVRFWLLSKGFGYRKLFWLTGFFAFFLSPIADNLTTALVMCAVILAVGKNQHRFVSVSCINIVVAANAGGAFSPFGDITTLMVWQKGVIEFWDFFALFLPSLVNFIVPAFIMQFAVPKGEPDHHGLGDNKTKFGGKIIACLFLATIGTAVFFQQSLGIPPVFGMMTGLAYLKLYGVIMAVGGLGYIGYLGMASDYMFGEFGAVNASILIGVISALVDNIPVMFAVLTMNSDFTQSQWLLVTLTAGVGGSLLSVGSAAGVALMGQARGQYTFLSHLKWSPVIALGYVASIALHLILNV